MMKINKSDCWLVPEGVYQGILREVKVMDKTTNGQVQQVIRLVFHLNSIKDRRFQMVVGKNFNFNQPAKFEADMVSWLGDEFYALLDEEGVLVLSKLEALVGRPAEIQVTEIVNSDHANPFSHVCSIKPVEKKAA